MSSKKKHNKREIKKKRQVKKIQKIFDTTAFHSQQENGNSSISQFMVFNSKEEAEAFKEKFNQDNKEEGIDVSFQKVDEELMRKLFPKE